MAKQITGRIKISEPCNQGWSKMQPVPGGRFCSKCQYVVRDLSGLGDAELAKLMAGPAAPRCGHLHKRQLGRTLHFAPAPARRWWPRLALGAMFVLAALPHSLLSQSPVATMGEHGPQPASKRLPLSTPKLLKGVVVEANEGYALTGYEVISDATQAPVITDENGRFEILLEEPTVRDRVLLEVMDDAGSVVFTVEWLWVEVPAEITIGVEQSIYDDVIDGLMEWDED